LYRRQPPDASESQTQKHKCPISIYGFTAQGDNQSFSRTLGAIMTCLLINNSEAFLQLKHLLCSRGNRLKVLFLLISLVTCAHAELHVPESTVSDMVNAAHSNNLSALFKSCDVVKIASHPRHGKSQSQLLEFLLSIDPKKIKYAPIKFVNGDSPVTVRMIEPFKMDFDLQWGPHSTFVVIGIHP
jgi:hypothetical protein